ncbi:NAD(P)-dependent dehydrogenase (short-subunit alcohol dehydrogenase family) [Sphingomonas jejuensis]|uniref:NAD(P)-dependent dehydrogenase (Short-subunit alcohol dehydrogenase family) n=1 Tax=Sphingomonas jejuensis TaxID=904715 RepID=A0ABX0XNI8_9SPHN|nr:SDR family NAD(P)-dependent oxidoreductase [Sphingomonas jejuensis]NJC34344.1 NAD(P)-dependent dehydrogenase (short-subunit alcohol dehydrogenase family) [Sphingomonas jejuensis]
MTPEFGGGPRTAIVTGAGRRIGRALAEALGADGWTVLLHCNRSVDGAMALRDSLGAGRVVVADLVDPNAPAHIVAALDGLPPPALLVNNASLFDLDGFDDMTVAAWDRHMAINARAPAFLTRAFAAAVPARAGGLVVNLLDAKLENPNPDFFSYTVSKMAFAGMAEIAARVLAPRGIRMVGIAPSVTLVSGPQTREGFDAVHRVNALGRGVSVADIVSALRFAVASPVLTGQTIVLDAGQRFLRLPRDVQFMEP